MTKCIYFSSIIFDTSNPRLARLRCKQWTCEYCSQINKKQWRKTLFDYIESNPQIAWSFHTFTLPSKYRKMPTVESVRFIKRQWQKLLQALNRLYGHFEFVRVIEFHQDGTPHIHLLAGFNIPRDDLSKSKSLNSQYIKKLKHRYTTTDKRGKKRKYPAILTRLGYGYITNSQNAIGVPSKTVSYITKYMTKIEHDKHNIAKLEKLRIIQTSRGIKRVKPEIKEGNWQIRHHLTRLDYLQFPIIKDLNKDKNTTIEDLDDFGVYPHADEYLTD